MILDPPIRSVKISPRVTVLATLHVVQGAEKRLGNVNDPMYVALLDKLMISEGVDFIFEEASGLGPTIAEKLALERLPFGHYVDIDPGSAERPEVGSSAAGLLLERGTCHRTSRRSRSRSRSGASS